MFYDNLILNKNEDVFIDKEIIRKLQKYQVQGIRTLYEQFKKKKPGIILNDPPLTGVTDEVVLFLKAVRHVIVKPILILSRSPHYWNDLYCQWPQGSDVDIICGSTKPTSEPKVYINSMLESPQLLGPAYGVVVVDTEDFTLGLKKELENVKADFKIIIISKDLKLDLSTFTAIHSWTAPTEESFILKLLDKLKALKNNIEKAFLIECIFEGIVYRRNINGECYHEKNRHILMNVEEPQIKNKDVTGTKIKRSKKAAQCSTDTDIDFNESCNQHVSSAATNKHLGDEKLEASTRRRKIEQPNLKSYNDVDTGNNAINDELKLSSDDEATYDEAIKYDFHVEEDETFGKRKRKNILVYSDDEDFTTNETTKNCSPPLSRTSGETRNSPEINSKNDKNTSTKLFCKSVVNELRKDILNNDNSDNHVVKDQITIEHNNLPFNTDTKCESTLQDAETNIEVISKCENSKILETSILSSQFDAQMKSLEEETAKKFKGSLLDSLF